MSKRPQFAKEFRKWMAEKEISSFDQIAKDLSAAGYRPGKSGKLYRSKVSGFIHENQAVPDALFYWLDQVYGLDDVWSKRLARSRMADALKRPYNREESW